MTGHFSCVRKRSWPDALLEEIGDPAAHRPRPLLRQVDRRGLHRLRRQEVGLLDAEATERDVDNVVRAKGASRMATTDLGKFRARAAARWWRANSRALGQAGVRPAPARACARLARPGARERRLPRLALLRRASARRRRHGGRPVVRPRCCEGTSLSDQSLKNALYVVGEPRRSRRRREFADAMRQLAHGADADHAGAGGGRRDAARTRARGSTGYVAELLVAQRFAQRPAGALRGGVRIARRRQGASYLKGVAPSARSRRSRWSSLEGGTLLPYFSERTQSGRAPRGRPWPSADSCAPARGPRRRERAHAPQRVHRAPLVPRRRSRRRRAAARARCASPPPSASSPTTLTASPSTRSSRPALYEPLEALSSSVREAAASHAGEDLLGSVFADYADRQAAWPRSAPPRCASPGAPRGTWAGIDREFRRPDLTSDDSALDDDRQAGARRLPRPAAARGDQTRTSASTPRSTRASRATPTCSSPPRPRAR